MATKLVPIRPTSCTDPLLELGSLHQNYVRGIDKIRLPDENIIVKKPWLDEPPGSSSYDEQAAIAVPGVGTIATVLEFDIPAGYDGVIKALSCNVNFCGLTEGSGDIVWQLTINGRPVQFYDNITVEKGTMQIPRPISPIRIFSGDIVKWIVNHVANGALVGSTVCSLSGYIYPSKGIS